MENRICIVVIGYNRVGSLKRCLDRLNECNYENDVDLYISIDNSIVNQTTLEVAQEYKWKFGNKFVIDHNERLGTLFVNV